MTDRAHAVKDHLWHPLGCCHDSARLDCCDCGGAGLLGRQQQDCHDCQHLACLGQQCRDHQHPQVCSRGKAGQDAGEDDPLHCLCGDLPTLCRPIAVCLTLACPSSLATHYHLTSHSVLLPTAGNMRTISGLYNLPFQPHPCIADSIA